MPAASTYAVNAFAPADGVSLLLRPLHAGATGKRAVIAIHGRGGDGAQWKRGWSGGDHADAIAAAGYWLMAPAAGGPAPWTSPAAMAGITAAYTYLLGLGIAGPKVGLMGWSGGGGAALQWMKENPALVAGALLWAPMSDLDHFHALGAYTAEIDAVFAGDYANSAGRRIADEFPTWRNLAPIRIVQGAADPTVTLALSQAFVAGVGQPQVTLTTTAGPHDTFALVPTADTVAFFDAAAWS